MKAVPFCVQGVKMKITGLFSSFMVIVAGKCLIFAEIYLANLCTCHWTKNSLNWLQYKLTYGKSKQQSEPTGNHFVIVHVLINQIANLELGYAQMIGQPIERSLRDHCW